MHRQSLDRDAAPPQRERIAVIAVHGVGDQQPLATARAIGDLLQAIDVDTRLDDGCAVSPSTAAGAAEARYDPFSERMLRINVRPVVIRKDEASDVDAGDTSGPFHAWVHRERRRRTNATGSSEMPDAYDAHVAHQFMRGQLQGYQGEDPEDTYETIRLEGKRTRHGGAAELTVHVYELYWADLSRLKARIFSIFTELYQVLFHLSSLGTHVVDAEALHHSHVSWGWFRRLQSWASICLAVPIPIINLFMVGVAVESAGLLAFERLPLAIQVEAATSVAGAIVVAAGGYLLWRGRNQSVLQWTLPVFLWVGLAAITWAAIERRCGGYDWRLGDGRCEPLAWASRGIASSCLAVAAGALVALAIAAYDRRRPGASRWGAWLAAVLFPTAFATIAWTGVPASNDGAVFVCFRLLECLYIAVMLTWGVFVVLAIAAWGAGHWAVKHLDSPADGDQAARSRWTARLMLSIPPFVFIVITLIAWGLIEVGLDRLLTHAIPYLPVTTWFRAPTVHVLLDNLQKYGGGQALPILLAVGLLAALPAIWGLAPVVWPEVRPPDFQRSRRAGYSERLGDWLTVTLLGLRISGQLLYVTTTFVMPLVVGWILFAWLVSASYPQIGAAGRSTRELLGSFQILGSISGALFAWLFAMRGQLKKAALGFRTVVDVMLDVDSWLREHPLDGNPKARICGRYVSLLRYICNWRDPFETEKGYDAIVFLAHSQGTAITADLLRFLRHEAAGNLRDYDPQLEPLERMHLSLFTMGCPLRDLYGLRFPRLYAWARHADATAMASWAANDLVEPRREPAGPDPRDLLGLTLWVNAYRSGDYVGRFLWRTIPCGYLWTSDLIGAPMDAPMKSVSSDGVMRMEFCIGAGAHTHYWDRTAPTIARELDRLIAL